MKTVTAPELLDRLRMADETVEIEAKTGSSIDTSVLQTVSAMSNEPGLGGGWILLGVAEEPGGLFGVNFVVVGVKDSGKLQADLATRCRNDLQPAVRPEIRPEELDGKTVILAYVPEAPAGQKPIFIKAEGLPSGAYRRVAGTDQHCTDDDLAVLFQQRMGRPYDETPVEGSSSADIDADAVREYRLRRAEVNKEASELGYRDEELLRSLNATTEHGGKTVLTVAGLVLFGKESSLRRLMPMTRVDYVIVEGKEWVANPDERFSSIDMRGPLMTLVPRVVQRILADLPSAFSLGSDAIHRRDVPLIPRQVIREAVVNAVMHRNYRTASPIQIIRYTNRIEIRNVGYSLKPEDRLGEPGSLARNPAIAAVLHEAGLAETKGSGIRTMRKLMRGANLTPPIFESDRQKDDFGLMLLVHHLFGEEDLAWLRQFADLSLTDNEARMLVVVRETGAITNAMFRDITGADTLTASKSLSRLRDAGLLKQKGKGRATYYVGTGKLMGGRVSSGTSKSEGTGAQSEGLPAQSKGLRAQSEGLHAQSKGLLPQSEGLPAKAETGISSEATMAAPVLPPDLRRMVDALGGRPQPEKVREVILRLCEWSALSAAELGAILGRDASYVRNNYLSPMVAEGLLTYTVPSAPAHPQQKYVRTNGRK